MAMLNTGQWVSNKVGWTVIAAVTLSDSVLFTWPEGCKAGRLVLIHLVTLLHEVVVLKKVELKH